MIICRQFILCLGNRNMCTSTHLYMSCVLYVSKAYALIFIMSYVQVLVCVMCCVWSALCAAFSVCCAQLAATNLVASLRACVASLGGKGSVRQGPREGPKAMPNIKF